MEKNSELSIKDLIRNVQKELILSQETREKEGIPPLFKVEDLEIEIKFAVKKESTKKGGVDFRLIALQAGKAKSSEEIHTLRLKLKAIPEKRGVAAAWISGNVEQAPILEPNGASPLAPSPSGGYPAVPSPSRKKSIFKRFFPR